MAESELTTVARPYARAIFARALDGSSDLDSWSAMLGQLAAVVQDNGLRAALDNPLLAAADKARLLIDIMADVLRREGLNLINLLAENGRISLLPSIAASFALLKASYEETIRVEVVSAYAVDAMEQEKLRKALSEKLRRQVSLTARVDAALIGGVIIRAEDTVIDNSVRGKLEKLSQAMA